MSPLDGLLRQELGALALELARVAGLVVVTPLPWQSAPKRLRAGVVFLLAFLVHGQGQVGSAVSSTPELAVFGITSEFALGAAMGFVVRLAVAVAEIAADAIAPVIGFGIAQVFDPTSGQQDTVLTTLFRSLAIWIALLTGLHHVVIGSLLASFHALPVGSLVFPSQVSPLMVEASSMVLSTGVRLALPVLAVLMIVQLALGFVSRAAPAMQIFSVGFAFSLITGGVALALALPDVGRELGGLFATVGPRMEEVLRVAGGS